MNPKETHPTKESNVSICATRRDCSIQAARLDTNIRTVCSAACETGTEKRSA